MSIQYGKYLNTDIINHIFVNSLFGAVTLKNLTNSKVFKLFSIVKTKKSAGHSLLNIMDHG